MKMWRSMIVVPAIALLAMGTGTPTQAGTFNFRARVTDSDETQFFEDSVQSITISS